MALTSCGHESTRGTTLFRAISAAGPWTEIGAVETMPELSPTHATESCTDPFAGGSAAWVTEYKTGELNGNDASFGLNWVSGDAMHEQLYADFISTDEIWIRIALSDVNATTRDFPYLVKGVTEPIPGAGGKIGFNLSGKVNGEIIRS